MHAEIDGRTAAEFPPDSTADLSPGMISPSSTPHGVSDVALIVTKA
jgi:hypothetical protein